MKRALSLLLALLMAASLVMPQAWAAGLQEPEPDAVVQQTQPDTAEPDAQLPQADTLAGNAAGLTPITRTKNAVASAVTLEKVVMRNVNGSQVVGYLSEIDLSKDVTLKASYTGYYYDGSTAAQRRQRFVLPLSFVSVSMMAFPPLCQPQQCRAAADTGQDHRRDARISGGR